jgi:hypothetical protein
VAFGKFSGESQKSPSMPWQKPWLAGFHAKAKHRFGLAPGLT